MVFHSGIFHLISLFNFVFKSCHTFFSPLFSITCFTRRSMLRPQHKQHTVSPTFLFNQLHVFSLSHQFVYFNKAVFYASSVGDSSSCVRDGTLWQTFETPMMQPLRSDKSLHCCPVKASCPRHAIVHKDHILHDCPPQTHSNPISRVILSGGNGCFLSRKATKHLIPIIHVISFQRHYCADFSHMRLLSDWLFSVLGKSHGYLYET